MEHVFAVTSQTTAPAVELSERDDVIDTAGYLIS